MKEFPPFGFRIRFLAPKNQSIDYDRESFDIEIPCEGKLFKLTTASGSPLKDSYDLVIRGNDFDSKEEAYNSANNIKKALLLCGLFFNMGFDMGRDKATFFLGEIYKEKILAFGYRAIEDIHGICIFSENIPVKIINIHSKHTSLIPINTFISKFIKVFEKNPNLSDKQSLAIELFNLSYFEESSRAKYLTLFTSVECLSHPKKGATRKACHEMVKEYIGSEFLTEFDKFYDIRNSLVHAGTVPKGIYLESKIIDLRKLLTNLIKKMIFQYEDV